MIANDVAIRGGGVAACCCAHLLKTGIEAADRPKLPAILVNDATQELMRDVFGRTDLFEGLPRIERRVVAWGAKAVELPHRAVVISEEELRARLAPGTTTAAGAEWTVHAASRPPGSGEQHFGTRQATAVSVTLRDDVPGCWVESVATGWLFLIPGWLLAVGGDTDELLAESQLVAAQIAHREPAGPRFAAYPRIVDPLCGPRWLACGSAALAFDPLCGDGTGYAVREGILAAAVVRAALRGGDANALLEHYRRRTIAAFGRHLDLCREFYRTGGGGEWWRGELAAIGRGIAWCREELGEGSGFRYRLSGYDLVPVENAPA